MAKKKISELPAAAATTGAEILPIVQGGNTVKATVSGLIPPGTYVGPMVDLAAKGADMTGATGSRAAFLSALNGGVGAVSIHVPVGTALLEAAVTLANPFLHFKGEGMWRSTIKAGALVMFGGDNSFPPVEELVLEDLCLDLAGVASVALSFNAHTTLRRVVLHNVRVTNLVAGADVIRINSGVLYLTGTTLFHNPAAHAGRGRVALLGPGARMHWENTVESHWLNQDMATSAGSSANRDQDVTEGHYLGGYHDQYWPYIPASHSGEGGTVTYTATAVIDTAADFTAVAAAAYPNVAPLRAMPVRQNGTTTTASDSQLIDTAATFIANGVKRGDTIRVAGKWAIVEAVQSETVINVFKWFDNTTLRPTSRPAVGAAYTVYGFIYGYATSKTGTTQINVPYWTDWFGVRATPAAGTRYEVMQARPSQMLAPGYGARSVVIPDGARYYRGWADMAGTIPAKSTIRGHFRDGQDMGITIAGADCDIDAFVEHCGAGAVWVGTGDRCSIAGKFIGNGWNFDNAGGAITPVTVSGSSRCTVKPGTLFKKTVEGTQAVNAVKFSGTGTGNQVLDIINDGHTNDLDVVSNAQTDARIRGVAPKVISSGISGVALINGEYRRNPTAEFLVPLNNLVDVPGMSFPVGANEVWEFDGTIDYDSTVTNDARFGIIVPAGATYSWSSDGIASTASSQLGDRNAGVVTANYQVNGGSRAAGAAKVPISARMRGVVTMGGTAGVIQLRASKNFNTDTASPADDLTVYANSYLIARRVA